MRPGIASGIFIPEFELHCHAYTVLSFWAPVIITHFQTLTDPRQEGKINHPLSELIAIALCASICGVDSWADVERFAVMKEDWFAKFLKLEHGIPSHDTFSRVFSLLDTEEMYQCVQQWIASLELCMKDQGVHIDGKTLRRSFDKSSDTSALQVVSAWASDLSLCLGQVAVDKDSNEITAVPQLLELLEITGAVVTLDAMHCQTKTAAKIREKKVDYILTVKGNQTTLQNSISELFIEHGEEGYKNKNVRVCKTTEESHGRTEMRRVWGCFIVNEQSMARRVSNWFTSSAVCHRRSGI